MSMTETAAAPSFLSSLTADELETFSERAGVLEYDGGLTREEAERVAYKNIMEARKKAPTSAIEAPTSNANAEKVKTHDRAPEMPPIACYCGLQALQKMTEYGVKMIGAYETGHSINRARVEGDYDNAFTNDIAEIKALIAGLGDGAGRGQGKKIELFRFIPGDYDFLCLDIDRGHSDGVDGLKELYTFFDSIGKTKNNLPPYLQNLPHSFPCYVTTPSGGFHLYFKYNGVKSWGLFANVRGVEIKHMKPGLTAPGSRKPNGEYVLYGELNNAPLIPPFIKNRLTLPKAARPPEYVAPGREKKKYGAASWEKIGEWVDEDGSYGGRNDRAYAYAVKAKTHGWAKPDTLRALRMEPTIQGLPETEYISVVESAYK